MSILTLVDSHARLLFIFLGATFSGVDYAGMHAPHGAEACPALRMLSPRQQALSAHRSHAAPDEVRTVTEGRAAWGCTRRDLSMRCAGGRGAAGDPAGGAAEQPTGAPFAGQHT